MILGLCVGGTDLNQWKQGNTWFIRTKKTSNGGLFLCFKIELINDYYKCNSNHNNKSINRKIWNMIFV